MQSAIKDLKTLAIIGSNGVLGADILSALDSSYKVTPINKQNYGEVKGSSFDIIINANGNSKRFWANEHILEDFEASTMSVYKSLLDFNYKKYIYISSSDVYFDHTSINTTQEDQASSSTQLSPYGFHKFLSETIVKNYAKDYVILRSSLILGKNLKKGPIYDAVHEKPLFISLQSQIQMILSTEIASIADFMIKNNISEEVFNMGGTGTVDFTTIEEYLGKNPEVTKQAEKQTYEMNVSKLQKLYPLKESSEYLKEYLIQLKENI